MKNTILYSLIFCSFTTYAQVDTARYASNFMVHVPSNQVSPSVSNTACVDFKLYFYDTTYWDYSINLKHQVQLNSIDSNGSEYKNITKMQRISNIKPHIFEKL